MDEKEKKSFLLLFIYLFILPSGQFLWELRASVDSDSDLQFEDKTTCEALVFLD